MSQQQMKQSEVWAKYLEENPYDYDVDDSSEDGPPASAWRQRIRLAMASLECEIWRIQGMAAELRRDRIEFPQALALRTCEAEIFQMQATLERWSTWLCMLEPA